MQVIKTRNATIPFNNSKESGITNYDSWLDEYNTAPRSRRQYQLIFDNREKEVVNPYKLETTNSFVEDEFEHEDGSVSPVYTVYYMLRLPSPHSGMLAAYHSLEKHVSYFINQNVCNSLALRTQNTIRSGVCAFTTYSIRAYAQEAVPDRELPNELYPQNYELISNSGYIFVQKGDYIQVIVSYYNVSQEKTSNPFSDDLFFGLDVNGTPNLRLQTMLELYWIE